MRNPRSNRSLLPHKKVVQLYLRGWSTIKLGKRAKISASGIYRILKYNNVPIRPRAESERLKRKYDYEKISKEYKNGTNIIDLAKKYKTDEPNIIRILKATGVKLRGHRSGENNPLWKGGKTYDHSGYIVQKEGKTHRLVIEKTIGRKLEVWESVHHIDGKKENYAVSNLAILKKEDHNRYHTFIRQAGFKNGRENFEKFCKKKSKFIWFFTKDELKKTLNKLNIKLASINKNKKPACRIRKCNGLNAGRGYCSKHYQRTVAKEKGYWKSSGGRRSKFLGKF